MEGQVGEVIAARVLARGWPWMRPARVAALLALLVAAMASAWIAHVLGPPGGGGGGGELHEPDFYLENFETTVMDEQGQPRRRIEAEYMAHFPDTNTKELSRPRLMIYRAAGAPWRVQSERGWISAGDDVMLLLGKVRIWRDDPSGVPEIEIHTQDLRVLPATEYGETDRPVVIRTATSESHAVGMRAYLRQSRLELLAEVRTRYEKKRP